ncbi:MAG TPA: NAD(P)/FAD-dependent oxidoreductase [Micromonosporaceae bacterium]
MHGQTSAAAQEAAAGNDTADVVVIGGGHNGLVCAAYLAEAGLEVLVVEGRDAVGGNTITEELTFPGWRHDSCSSAHVVLQSNPLIRDDELGLLSRYGLSYVHTDPAVVIPLGGDDSVVVHRDLEATAAELARWSSDDAAALGRMMKDWDAGLNRAHARWSAGLAPVDDDSAAAYEHLRHRSAWDVIAETFAHPVSRRVLSWLAFATIQPPRRPGTGALPAAITSGRLRYGWATPVGGSGALPVALVAHLEDHGGRVVVSAPVTGVPVEGGRAVGVTTADGRRYGARRAVVSSAHLAALPGLLGEQASDDVHRAAKCWRPGLALFAVHLDLRADVRYRTQDGPIASVAGGLGSPEGLRRQIDAARTGETALDDPWLLLVSSTVVDPGRAPGGLLKLLTIAPSAPSGAETWDDAAAEAYAGRLVEIAGAAVEGLSDADILAVLPESPTGLARRNAHNIGGSCHGGEFLLGDGEVVPGWQSYRTQVPGLYLTGSTAHPGGSVSGRPGRNAARTVLEDLGIDPRPLMPAT